MRGKDEVFIPISLRNCVGMILLSPFVPSVSGMEEDWKQEWDLPCHLAENALWGFVNKVHFKSWSAIRHESIGSQSSVVPVFTQTLIWQFIYIQQWFKLRRLERAADAGGVPTHLPQVTISTARMGQRLINQCPSFCVSQIGILRQASSSFCSC